MSPLLFVLVMDALSAMFSHAQMLSIQKFKLGVPLGEFGSHCNLYYMDDLLIMTSGGLEDLRIIKLILYLLKGMTGLATNFLKTCLYSSRLSELLGSAAADTLCCDVGLLPVTYLGIHVSGRRPHRLDWEGIILKVCIRLAS